MPSTQSYLFGNGTQTVFTFAHGLGTLTPAVVVFATDDTGRRIEGGEYALQVIDANTVRLTFAVAPGVNALRASVGNLASAGPTNQNCGPFGSGADSGFFGAFNASLCEAERVMGEPWCYNGVTYQAIETETVSTQMQLMPGGRYKNIAAVVHVRLAVFTASGVDDGKIIETRGGRMRVSRIENDGDDARALYCTSAQIRVPDL